MKIDDVKRPRHEPQALSSPENTRSVESPQAFDILLIQASV